MKDKQGLFGKICKTVKSQRKKIKSSQPATKPAVSQVLRTRKMTLYMTTMTGTTQQVQTLSNFSSWFGTMEGRRGGLEFSLDSKISV